MQSLLPPSPFQSSSRLCEPAPAVSGPFVSFVQCSALSFLSLAYQLVLRHRLIKNNIKTKLIANNYNYLSHVFFHLLNSNTYYNIHIYHYLIAMDFILHHTSIWFDIYLSESFVCESVFLSLPLYINTWRHISWVLFLYKQ